MYKIIDLDITHIDEIFQIESESFSDPWSKESFVSSIENPLVRMMGCHDTSDKFCGFICASVLPPEAEILDIAVSPSFRRMGVGKALINALLSSIRVSPAVDVSSAVQTVFLEVRESNIPARKLYQSFGFTESGKRPRYYSNPTEDAILMKLDLGTYSI